MESSHSPDPVSQADVLTLPPVNIDEERTSGSNAAKTAVIVCHGMGQQVKFQTIGDLMATLGRSGMLARPTVGRLVRFGKDLTLARAEAHLRVPSEPTLASSGPAPADPTGGHEVHVYEAYWAPHTEGRVTMRDVMGFLFHSGVDGLRYAVRRQFSRFLLNESQTFRNKRWMFLQFLLALGVVFSLVVINTAATMIVAALAGVPVPGMDWIDEPHLLRALSAAILLNVPAGVLLAAALLHPLPMTRAGQTCARQFKSRRASRVSALPMYALFVSVLATGVLCSINMALAYLGRPVIDVTLIWPDWFLQAPQTVVFLWGGVLLLSLAVRSFLIRYVGDVAAYLSAHRLNKFHDIREDIRSTVFRTFCAVYRDGGYRHCVVVGHSLGSVAAYDALNAVLVEQAVTGEAFSPTAGILTFGSPLDKTAFVFRTHSPKNCDVREALAGAVQPLISEETVRPEWVNIWSPNDIVSGPLDLYDRVDKSNRNAVQNLIDWEADRPFVAHVQYWNNKLLVDHLARLCASHPAPK